ncbi:hypothetical protein [Halocynthiibacter namhaensis]|uniref:hypothetical protein n=1 Tax=Halocynthiibacter namhaensis TaxID=1290553 RepID=UPI0005790147|nr:hypothetical protein [Halocynthiibacter namhaensis]
MLNLERLPDFLGDQAAFFDVFASELLKLSLQSTALLDLFDDHEFTLFLITLCGLASIQLVLLPNGFALACEAIK